MPTLVLIHRVHGEVKRLHVRKYEINLIVDRWRKMIGKKFIDCDIFQYPNITKKNLRGNKIIKILHIETGEYFNTITKASKKTRISFYDINHELNNDIVQGYKYRFKLVTIDIEPLKLDIHAAN